MKKSNYFWFCSLHLRSEFRSAHRRRPVAFVSEREKRKDLPQSTRRNDGEHGENQKSASETERTQREDGEHRGVGHDQWEIRMTFEELDQRFPNGFDDAKITAINID